MRVYVDVDGPEASSTPALLVTAETIPPGAGEGSASDEDTTPDVGDSMPVSRLAGLRGKFSSWRRKRKSIPAVVIADEEDDEDDDLENVADSEEPTAASSPSKPAVLQEPRAETASAAAQTESKTTARLSDTGGKPLGENMRVGATAKTPTAEKVLVTEGQVAAGEALLPLTESMSGRGTAVCPKETFSPASVGALAVTVTSEDRGKVKDAALPAAAHTLGLAGSEKGFKETSSGSEKRPVALVTTADPSDSLDLEQRAAALPGDDEPRAGEIEVAGDQLASPFTGSSSSGEASSGTGERALENAPPAGGTSVGGEAGDDTSSEQQGPPPSSSVGAVTPFADIGSDDKDALLGGPDVESPTNKERPSSTGSLGEGAAAAVVGNAKETVNTPGASTAAESTTAREQVAPVAAAPLENGERSADSFSPVPTGTALSPRSPSRNEASRKKKGSGNQTAQEMSKTPTKTEEKGHAEAGRTAAVGKPVVGRPAAEKPAVVSSKVVKDDMAAAAEEAVPRVAGKTGGVGGGSGAVEGPSSAWNAMNPAAEFLKDWVDKAVPQKKAELKQREGAVCWERQWCADAALGVVGTAAAVVCCIGRKQSRKRLVSDGLLS